MSEASPLQSVVLNVLGPNCALQVHQNSRLRLVQLDHHDGTEVTSLVPVGVEVARESPVRCVGDGSDVLHIRVVLAVAVEPGHVHPGTGQVAGPGSVTANKPVVGIILGPALVLPDPRDVLLQLLRHGGALVDLGHGVGHRLPVVDLVHLQQDAGFAVSVPGVEEERINISIGQTEGERTLQYQDILPVIFLRNTLVVRLRVTQPFLVELAAFVFGISTSTRRNE